MRFHSAAASSSILAVAAAFFLGTTPVRADFARDVALIQQGQLTLEEAVQKAMVAGENVRSVIVIATGVGFDLIQLSSALLNAGVDGNTIRAAMLAAGIDAAAITGTIAAAQAQQAAAAALTVTGPITGATGPGAGAGGGASPF